MERRRGFSLSEELRVIAPLMVIWILTLLVLIAIASTEDEHQRLLLQSPATSGSLPWYTGLVSYLSLCAWSVALTASFGAAQVSRLAGRAKAGRFLADAGLLTALLMVNEVFGIHYAVAPSFGVPKVVVIAGLALCCVAWAVRHVHEIRRTRRAVLGLAAVAIVASLGIDTGGGVTLTSLLAEEGLQLLGVIGWATYFVLTGSDICRSVVAPTSVEAAERASA